jgi:hypothetical protein
VTYYLALMVIAILVIGFVGWTIWWFVDRDRPAGDDRR